MLLDYIDSRFHSSIYMVAGSEEQVKLKAWESVLFTTYQVSL